MKTALFSFLLLLLNFPVFAQNTEKPALSPEHLRIRTELERDKTITPINCGLYTEVDSKRPKAQAEIKAQKENSRVKLLLYQASKTKDQTAKAKYTCTSVENTPVNTYLTVDKGVVRYIEDLTRDASGGLRVNQLTCKDLLIGHLVKNAGGSYEFKSFEDENYGDKIIVLQCKTADRTFIF